MGSSIIDSIFYALVQQRAERTRVRRNKSLIVALAPGSQCSKFSQGKASMRLCKRLVGEVGCNLSEIGAIGVLFALAKHIGNMPLNKKILWLAVSHLRDVREVIVNAYAHFQRIN
jgi:hypothetical protein